MSEIGSSPTSQENGNTETGTGIDTGYKFLTPLEQSLVESEPSIGSSDYSECLDSWVVSISNARYKGEGYRLSHNGIGALLHLLVAARVRNHRLVKERDEALKRVHKLLTTHSPY